MALVPTIDFAHLPPVDVFSYDSGHFCLRAGSNVYRHACHLNDFDTLATVLFEFIDKKKFLRVALDYGRTPAYVNITWLNVTSVSVYRTPDSMGMTKSVSVNMQSTYGFCYWSFKTEEDAVAKMREITDYLNNPML